MTETTISASNRQKGRGAKAEIRADVPSPFWYDPTTKAMSTLSTLLAEAASFDGDDDQRDSSDATRLIYIATDVVHERNWLDQAKSPLEQQDDIANNAFDVRALLTGAMHYPEQQLKSECRALLLHASAICNALSDLHCESGAGTELVTTLLEVIKQPPLATLRSQPQTSQRIAVHDPLHGKTPAQAAIVFERIASMCDTTRALVHQDAEGNEFAIGIMIESIGALADSMVDGEIIGSHADWSIGHSFRAAGKAVGA